MKKILLVLVLLIAVAGFSQDFEKKWQRVYALENEGKVKSASEEVDKIYTLSKNKKNEVLTIKTFFYRSKFLLVKEENAQAKILANLNSEIEVASEPAKAMLKTIYADCLKAYFNEYSYVIKERTPTELHQSDFKLWTEKDFLKKNEELYELKSASTELLKQTPLKNYKEILKTEKTKGFDKISVYDYVMISKIETYLFFLKNKGTVTMRV